MPTEDKQIIRLRHTHLLLATAVGLSLLGCRSGRPLASRVQVTEDPTAVVAEVPEAEQRLATVTGKSSSSKAPVRKAPQTDLASAVAGMPADPKTPVSVTDSSKVTQAAPQPESQPTAKPTPTKPVAVDDEIEVTVGGLVSASLTDLSLPTTDQPSSPSAESVAQADSIPADSIPADSDSEKIAASESPTTSAPATEQLVETEQNRPAVNRRPVRQTDLPNNLDAALEQSLASLPDLPPSSGTADGPRPTRIGSSQSQPQETHIGDVADESNSIDHDPSHLMNANQVRMVSHAGDQSRVGMASHALPQKLEVIPAEVPPQPLSEAELFEQLLVRLSDPRPDESPTDRERRQIVMRHLMVLAGQPEEAVASMEGLNPTEQLYLKNQLMGLWTMIDPEGHPSSGRRITEALPRFREATRHLATATDSLALKNLEFCTEIESYGQIKPFAGNRFSAGQQVILYCEVENFADAEKNGHYQTQLQGSYDIYDANGTKVISQLLPVDQQQSRNRLRDYFVAYQMNLPQGLPSGTYRLQLTLEDNVGKKYGQSNIPFEIR